MSPAQAWAQPFSWLAPLWLLLGSVMAFAWARTLRRGPTNSGSPRRDPFAAGWAIAALVVAAVALSSWLFSWPGGPTALDGGARAWGGAWVGDPLGAWADALAAAAVGGFAAVALVASRRVEQGQGATQRRMMAACLGAFSVGVTAHAADLASLWFGMELAALVALSFEAPRSSWRSHAARARARRAGALAFGLGALGVLLIFGATADLRLEGLSGRVAKVFNHWGGVQRYVNTLSAAGEALPSGFVTQAKGRVITGMAGAALLLPGVLCLSVGVLLRWLDPRRSEGLSVFSRLAALVLLARVFVGVLYAPRLVNEPYGWAGPVIALGLAFMAVSLLRAHKARSLRGVASGLAQANFGLTLICLVAAANFYGHRALANRPVAPTLELRWAQIVGDQALAAAVGLFTCTMFALGLLAWADRDELGLHDLEGQARQRPMWGAATLASLATLVGAPLTPGFALSLDALQSLMAHSELRWVLVACAGMSLTALVIGTRVVWRCFAPRPRALDPSDFPVDGGWRRLTWFLGAAAVVVAGLWPEPMLDRFELSTAGHSLGSVSPQRAAWLAEIRDDVANDRATLRIPEVRTSDDEKPPPSRDERGH